MRIRELRQEKGISQKELANHVGITVATLSSAETEIYTPSLDCLKKIAVRLDVKLYDLFEDKDTEGVILESKVVFSNPLTKAEREMLREIEEEGTGILLKERQKRGIAKHKFARFLGIGLYTLEKAELYGVADLSNRIKKRIADKLGMTVEELVENDY